VFDELGSEQVEERWIHKTIFVGNAQDDERFVGELGLKAFSQTRRMFFLHAENHVGPADVAGGDFDSRGVFRAGGSCFVLRMIVEKRFGGWTAPEVSRADEKKLGLQRWRRVVDA
jgi:hypothetical protein